MTQLFIHFPRSGVGSFTSLKLKNLFEARAREPASLSYILYLFFSLPHNFLIHTTSCNKGEFKE